MGAPRNWRNPARGAISFRHRISPATFVLFASFSFSYSFSVLSPPPTFDVQTLELKTFEAQPFGPYGSGGGCAEGISKYFRSSDCPRATEATRAPPASSARSATPMTSSASRLAFS